MTKFSRVRCRLKYSYSCFLPLFCFLVVFLLMIGLSVLFLVTVINLPPRFLCSLLAVVSTLQRYLQCWRVLFLFPPFLDTYSLSTSSLPCKVLCIVICCFCFVVCFCFCFFFFVLWFICRSSSLVHFKNGLKYLTSISPLVRFLLRSFGFE